MVRDKSGGENNKTDKKKGGGLKTGNEKRVESEVGIALPHSSTPDTNISPTMLLLRHAALLACLSLVSAAAQFPRNLFGNLFGASASANSAGQPRRAQPQLPPSPNLPPLAPNSRFLPQPNRQPRFPNNAPPVPRFGPKRAAPKSFSAETAESASDTSGIPALTAVMSPFKLGLPTLCARFHYYSSGTLRLSADDGKRKMWDRSQVSTEYFAQFPSSCKNAPATATKTG